MLPPISHIILAHKRWDTIKLGEIKQKISIHTIHSIIIQVE